MTRGAILILAAFGAAGCSRMIRVPRVRVAGPAIVVEHERFQLVAGQESETPFWARGCPAVPTPTNFDQGERMGAQRVGVRYPGLDAPLYGILAFCPVHGSVQGPVSRSYALQVPQEYVDATAGDQYSVVFEHTGRLEEHDGQLADLPAWILWLSRRPFPRQGRGARAETAEPTDRYRDAIVVGATGRWIPDGGTLDLFAGYRFEGDHEVALELGGVWYGCAEYFLVMGRYVGTISVHPIVGIRLGGSLGAVVPTLDCRANAAFALFALAGLSVDPVPWLSLFLDVRGGIAAPSENVGFVAIGGGVGFAIPT